MKRSILWLGAVVLALSVALAVWAVLIEPGQLRFKEYSVKVEGWPQEAAGFSVAFITDPHVGSPHIDLEKMAAIVAATNARRPDLILLGGDYVIQGVLGGHPVPSRDIVGVLSKLSAHHGVFGVLGNHDWWENAPRIHQEFKQHRVRILEDAAEYIPLGKQGFWLVGISDATEGPHNVAKALSAVHGSAPVLALTHSPDIFPEIPPRVALTLAGHTHGGQVWLPFWGRPVVPSKYGQRYAMGLISEEGRQLFVGPGIGTSILPIRFMTPPEVSILRIYPAPITPAPTTH